MFTKGNKKGDLLIGNIIFIVLNLIFLSILMLFLLRQGSGAIVLEQSYAKQIALLIDSSKPVMEIQLNMDKAAKLAEKNNIPFKDVVKIRDNLVIVKLSEKGGYSYSFFNDVDVTAYPLNIEDYVFVVSGYGGVANE
jgi:hypothetical protein